MKPVDRLHLKWSMKPNAPECLASWSRLTGFISLKPVDWLHEAGASSFMKPNAPERLASWSRKLWLHEANSSGVFGYMKLEAPVSWSQTLRSSFRKVIISDFLWFSFDRYGWTIWARDDLRLCGERGHSQLSLGGCRSSVARDDQNKIK